MSKPRHVNPGSSQADIVRHVYEASAGGRKVEVLLELHEDKEAARRIGARKLRSSVDDTLIRYLSTRHLRGEG